MSKIKNWKLIKSNSIHKTKWIELLEDECVVDGKRITYTYTKRLDEGPTIIPEDSDGKLWMVKQYRHPIRKIVWQFPTEGKNEGESWKDAARRGLSEEIGKRAGKLIDLGWSYIDPGGLRQKTKYFLAQDLKEVDGDKHMEEEFEDLNARSFSMKEIEELIREGKIVDNWTFSGLFLLQRHKGKEK